MTVLLASLALPLAFAPDAARRLASGLLAALGAALSWPWRRPRARHRPPWAASVCGLHAGLGLVRPIVLVVEVRRRKGGR